MVARRSTGPGEPTSVAPTILRLSIPLRPTLYQQSLLRLEIARAVAKERRADRKAPLVTACERAIEAHTDFAVSTVIRRAGAVARLLEVAYEPDLVDWETGARVDTRPLQLRFEGRAFLTELAARRFGAQVAPQAGQPRVGGGSE